MGVADNSRNLSQVWTDVFRLVPEHPEVCLWRRQLTALVNSRVGLGRFGAFAMLGNVIPYCGFGELNHPTKRCHGTNL